MWKAYGKHLAKRGIFLFLTLVIATYATIVIANLGGYVDGILRKQIEFEVSQYLARSPTFRELSPEEQEARRRELIEEYIKAAGLDKPFLQRSFIYLWRALILNLGRAMHLRSASGSSKVYDIILERLPWSMLLFTTGTIIEAVIGILLGVNMAKKALSKFDRAMIVASIISYTAPPWFYGILAILLFSFQLGLFPPGGLVSRPHESWTTFLPDLLHHLALPLMVWVLSFFGYWAYITRNLVLETLHQDYVMAARAKGLPERVVMRRYVLRPAAPPIVTMIALALIASWMGAIITEAVFGWPGLGSLYNDAVWSMDAPVLIGLTVMYAYLLVLTVFILDIIYGILDPRVRTVGA